MEGGSIEKGSVDAVAGALLWPLGAFTLFPIVGAAYSDATEQGRRVAIQSHGTIWALQQVIFLIGAMLVGLGEVNLARFYRKSRGEFAEVLSKAMVGLMGLGLIGFAASAMTFVLRSVSPLDNPLLVYWKIATWCILVSFGLLSLLQLGKNIATRVVGIVCVGWVLISAYGFLQMGRSFPPLVLFLVPLAIGLRLLMHPELSRLA